MFAMKNGVLLLFLAMLGACAGGGNVQRTTEKNQNSAQAQNSTQAQSNCQTKEQCLNDPNCLCWCSQVCNWRKKTPKDHPVYIENDRYGKYCYCKQWDYDHYEDNCINHNNVKQPEGAK